MLPQLLPFAVVHPERQLASHFRLLAAAISSPHSKVFPKPSLVPGTRPRSFRCYDCRKAGANPTRSQTMRTLTTLTAVAAIIAGISVAQAQGTMGAPSGSMQKAQTVGNSA